MKIDFAVLKKVEDDLKELQQIAEEKKYDKEVVFGKIEMTITSMESLHSINMDVVESYKKNLKKWEEQEKRQLDTIKEITEETKEASRLVELMTSTDDYDEMVKYSKQFDEHMEKVNQSEGKQMAILTEKSLFSDVSRDYMNITFTDERRTHLQSLRSRFSNSKKRINFGLILPIALLGLGIERIIEGIWPQLPDYVITFLLAIVFYFSIDKLLGAKKERALWEEIGVQISMLEMEFKRYIHQLITLYEFDNKKK